MDKCCYPQLDETVYRSVLPNGLTVCVVPRKGFTKKLAYFVTDYGAIHRDFVLDGEVHHSPAGVAHYLEHKMFDMPGGRDVSEELAAYGAMSNAFTSYDMTAYYFSTTDHFAECLRLLLEFVSTPCFTEESVRKEQGIIEQEIGMNLDDPGSVGFEDLVSALYEAHPVRTPILGDRDSIREITPQVLETCHRAFYTPGNMLLAVIGDVDPHQVEDMARQVLGDTPKSVGQKVKHWAEPLTPVRKLTQRNMEVAMPTFNLGFKARPLEHGAEGIRRELIGDLAAEALYGESSRLYLRLYEEGLIDSSFGGGFETLDGCAIFLCGGDSEDPQAVRDAILEEAKVIVREGIGEEDFLRMKRSALGRRIRGLDSFDSTCFRICAYHFSGFDYFRFPELYQDITAGDVLEFLEETVREEHCALSIINPMKEEL